MLIYSETVSPRLQYISKFILQEQLGLTVTLTTNLDGFVKHEGPKLNYSRASMDGETFNLQSHALLFEKIVISQEITLFTDGNQKVFFKATEGDYSFDIFAASFYLISRYEEWLPHAKDVYGRY